MVGKDVIGEDGGRDGSSPCEPLHPPKCCSSRSLVIISRYLGDPWGHLQPPLAGYSCSEWARERLSRGTELREGQKGQ